MKEKLIETENKINWFYAILPFVSYIAIIIMFFNLSKQSPDKYEYMFLIFFAEFISIHSTALIGNTESIKVRAIILLLYSTFIGAFLFINLNAGIILFLSLLSKVLNNKNKFTNKNLVNTGFFILSFFIIAIFQGNDGNVFQGNDDNKAFIYWGIFYYFGMIVIEIWSIFSKKDEKVVDAR